MALAPRPRLGQRAPETTSEKAMRERAVNRPLVVFRFVIVLIYGRRLSFKSLDCLLHFARANLPQSRSAPQPNIAIGIIAF